jgi:hypothetical protein
VVSRRRWVVRDLASIDSALRRAQAKATENPESYRAWLRE